LIKICDIVKEKCLEEDQLPDDWPEERMIKEEFKKLMATLMPKTALASDTVEKFKEVLLDAAGKGCPTEVLTYLLPKVKCRDIGEAHCVAVNMSLFLTKNGGSLEGFTNDGIRDALKVQGMLIGSYQNHFLRPGWFPESKEEYQ